MRFVDVVTVGQITALHDDEIGTAPQKGGGAGVPGQRSQQCGPVLAGDYYRMPGTRIEIRSCQPTLGPHRSAQHPRHCSRAHVGCVDDM